MNHRFWRSISELRHIKILSTSPACTSCAWDKRTACSKYFKPTFLNLVARLHYCSVGENRRLCSFAPVSYNNHKLLVRSPVIQCAAVRTTAQSSSARSFGQPVNEDKGYIPTDLGSNIRLHMENVYLSWMRNAYIMTLASITITNFAVSPTPAIISTVALTLAGMSITVGSIGYLYNLSYMRNHGHMSKLVSWVCQLGTIAHFFAWYIAASILLPELKIINEEINEIEEEELEKVDK